MEGKHPRSGRWLRRAGADGTRAGGIDLTFSAPKSVSTVWALAGETQRCEIEAAHAAAVHETIGHLTETVPAVRHSRNGRVVEEPARDLVAAEYRHTTARGVLDGDMPDPQLHSHVVITSAIREDGKLVAVASRPIFRSARELGGYYRSALAHQLQQRGYRIERGTGKLAATSSSPTYQGASPMLSALAAARSPGPRSASAPSTGGHPKGASCAS